LHKKGEFVGQLNLYKIDSQKQDEFETAIAENMNLLGINKP